MDEAARHAAPGRLGVEERVHRRVAEKGAGRRRQARRDAGAEERALDRAEGQRGGDGRRRRRRHHVVAEQRAVVVGDLEVGQVEGDALEPDRGLARPEAEAHHHGGRHVPHQLVDLRPQRAEGDGQDAARHARALDLGAVEPYDHLGGGVDAAPAVRLEARQKGDAAHRFQSCCDGTRRARLNLLDAFSQAMTAVSSTSASSS